MDQGGVSTSNVSGDLRQLEQIKYFTGIIGVLRKVERGKKHSSFHQMFEAFMPMICGKFYVGHVNLERITQSSRGRGFGKV